MLPGRISYRGIVCGFERSDLRNAILEIYPKADTNGDGGLSSEEQAAVSRMVLKKFLRQTRTRTESCPIGAGSVAPESRRGKEEGNAGCSVETSVARTDSGRPHGWRSLPFVRGHDRSRPSEHGVGRQIPDVSFTDIVGKQHRLSDFANRKPSSSP